MKHRTVALALLVAFVAVGVVGCGGGKVTKENADKVKVGMTEDEVIGILGEPTEEGGSMSVSMPGMGSMSQKFWKDGDKVITVQFQDGKVVSKVYGEAK